MPSVHGESIGSISNLISKKTKSSRVPKNNDNLSVNSILNENGFLTFEKSTDLLVDNVSIIARNGGNSLSLITDLIHIMTNINDIQSLKDSNNNNKHKLSNKFWDCFSKSKSLQTLFNNNFTCKAINLGLDTKTSISIIRDTMEASAIKATRAIFVHLYETGEMKRILSLDNSNKKRKLNDDNEKIVENSNTKLANWIRQIRTAFVAICMESAIENINDDDIKNNDDDTKDNKLKSTNKDRNRKQLASIESLFTILRLESKYCCGDQMNFDNSFFIKIIKQLLIFNNKQITPLVRQELLRRIDSFIDIRYYFYKAITKLLHEGMGISSIYKLNSKNSNKYNITENQVSSLVDNGISILLRISPLITTEEDKELQDPESKLNIIRGKSKKFKRSNKNINPLIDDDDLIFDDDLDNIKLDDNINGNQNNKNIKLSIPTVEGNLYIDNSKTKNGKLNVSLIADNHRKVYGECWVNILKQPLSSKLHRNVLLILHSKIVPFVKQPEMFISFLSESYDSGGISSLLALNGLYHLMTRCNLDYPKFWIQLYALLVPDIFQVKYRERFIELFNLFMSSAHLPSTLVASFLKRLSRLMLRSPLDVQMLIIPLMISMIKRHPATVVTIHRILSSEENSKCIKEGYIDPYDENEIDPLLTNAIDSSLWELDIIREQHFNKDILSIFELLKNKSIFSL